MPTVPDYVDPATGIAPLEFRVNALTLGNQDAPAVSASDPNEDAIIAWVGPNANPANTIAIYVRDVDPPTQAEVPSTNPSISVANAAVVTDGSAAHADFTVSLAAASSQTVSVRYSTADGTAKAGINYLATSGTLVFEPGQTSKTISVSVLGLSEGLPSLTFLMQLQSPTDGKLLRSSGTGTILGGATALAVNINSVAPVVTTNPSNQTVNAGQPASFTAAASGTPTPTVQWQVSTNGGSSFTAISGATSTTYTFTTTAAASGSLYRAVFTNSSGTATTTAATLSVNTPNTAPVVTTNPINQAVNAGQSVSFTAAASGTPTPTVQWQVSTNGGSSFTPISGATSTTYTFTATAAQSGYRYRAVFTNVVGPAATTAATLSVNTNAVVPVVTTNPNSQAVNAGQTVYFTAAASGTPTPTVQWQVSTNGGSSYTVISGATSTSYTFTTTAAASGSLYRAVFTNSAGTATTTAATLTVNTAPVVATNPGSQTIYAGLSVSLTATATGTPTPNVQWQVSTNGGSLYLPISGATSTTYTFTTTAAESGSLYRAVFTNIAGTATTTAATLTVYAPPVVTTNPSSQTVNTGLSVSFTAAASGTPTPAVQWQVSINGGATYASISGATSTTYAFTVTPAQSGDLYQAVFTNISGSAATTAAMLTVDTPPVVTTNPASQTVNAGQSASFTVAATGLSMPTAQWQVSTDGGATYTSISGSTSAPTKPGSLWSAPASRSSSRLRPLRPPTLSRQPRRSRATCTVPSLRARMAARRPRPRPC